MHFSVAYHSLLFPMSLTAYSLLKTAYHHVPKNLLMCLRKVRCSYHVVIPLSPVVIPLSPVVIPLSPVRASLEQYVREATFFLCVNSNCQADSAFVAWDACCMAFLLTYTHGNKRFSLKKTVSTPLLVSLR